MNPNKAPSLVWGGMGLFDPRGQYDRIRYGALGFSGTTDIPVVDAVPSTKATNNISASASPGAGAIVLVSTTGAGITVLASALTVWPSGNIIPAGALAIDGPPGLVTFGRPQLSSGNTVVSLYDPTKALSRAVILTSGGNDSGINFTVNGYDVYGFPMTQTLAGGNVAAVTTTKTFKFITSVTHTGSVTGTLIIGTTDVFGFPMRVDTIGYVSMAWASSLITANTGFVLADTTSPATAATGDVRGTYLTQSTSDGTKRLQVFITPSVANLGTNTGLFGVAQV
jgi:ribosomal protein S6E (S10)